MRYIPWIALALLGTSAADPEVAPQSQWHTEVGKAFAEARRDRKPVFAVIHCPH